MVRKKKKTLVIGLDGGSFEMIRPWIEKGELLFFKKIMENGVYGGLKSIMPPASVPAWSVIFKGKQPGKIGAFYINWIDENYEFKYNNSTTLKGNDIWDILGENGYTVGLYNIPGSHPPKKVNGWMISELSSSDVFTYPNNIAEKIPKEDVWDEKDPLKRTYENFERNLEAMKILLDKKFDFTVSVFHMVDIHFQNVWQKDLLKAYKTVGEKLDSILSQLDKEYNIFILSDHGIKFTDNKSTMLFLGTWLMNNGYLKLKKEKNSIRRKTFVKINSKIREFLIKIKFTPRQLHFFKQHLNTLEEVNYDNVDFSRTRIFQHVMEPFPYSGLYINVKNRYIHGIVDQGEYDIIRNGAIEKLKKDGIIAHKTEEVYPGAEIGKFPDIIVGHEGMVSPLYHSKLFSSFKSGHSMNGIFMAYGPDVAKGREIKSARLEDITPTILHLLGIPVPKDMDGKVLRDVFAKGSNASARRVKKTTAKPLPTPGKKEAYSTEEQKKLRERLKSMGYM